MEELLQETGFTRRGYLSCGDIEKSTETGTFAIALQLEPHEIRDGFAYIARAVTGELKTHLQNLRTEFSKTRCFWIKPCRTFDEAESIANSINDQAFAGGLVP